MIDFEKARQKTMAEQPRLLELARALIRRGAAVYSYVGEVRDYVAVAPWSRLAPGLFEYQELTADGPGPVRRIEFDMIDLTDWGGFPLYVEGNHVGWLEPVEIQDDKGLSDIWRQWSAAPPPPEFAAGPSPS